MASSSLDHEYLQKARDKLGSGYHDLECNVTHIYKRVPTHLAYDLVAHSVLGFSFQGERVKRGWVEGLIVGDTRVGKSEVAEKLARHYQLGRIVNCERVSFAGAVGGMQQIGKAWNIQWGVIPLNDRRMVVLDEATGLTTAQISEMSGMRSSGIAEITKIQQERTPARCRMLWIANPRSDYNRRINSYAYGVQTVAGVMGRAEDIARLDFAIVVSGDDVGRNVLNAKRRPKTEHVYASELCRNRLLWAWSRRPDQVHFVDGCEDFILDEATRLSEKYSQDVPIVEPSEQRIRLARLSAALACVLFSSDETGEIVRVRPEHTRLVTEFLEFNYDSNAMRYDKFSRIRKAQTEFTKAGLTEAIHTLKRRAQNGGGDDGLVALLSYLNESEEIDRSSMADATGWNFEDVRQFIQIFTSKIRGLKPGPNRKLIKTELMLAALKRLDEEV